MELFQIKRLNQETIDEQIAVFRLSFSIQEEIEITRKRWVKKHYENPCGNSYIFGAYDGDLLIGINAFSPKEYSYRGKTYRFLQSCESGMRPSHRRKGAWGQIVRFAMEYFQEEGAFDALIGFPNVENSYQGFLKLGWKQVAYLDNYLMVNRGDILARIATKRERNLLVGKIFEIQKFVLLLTGQTPASSFFEDKWTAEVSLTENAAANVFTLKRTPEVLNWKHSYQEMQVCDLKQGDKLIARCYYTRTDYGKNQIIRLLSLDVNRGIGEEHLAEAAACIWHVIEKNSDTAFLRVWVSRRSSILKTIKKLCFIRAKHKNPFIVYPLKGTEEDRSLLLSEENWLLSFMDLD